MLKLFNRDKIYVQKYSTLGGEVALMRFEGNIKGKILEKLRANYAVQGDHIDQGGSISPKAIFSIMSASTSLGLTNLASGQLFMATASASNLMAIGGGYGSAIMGTSGIIGQAPFIPVGGAIMSVAAPLLIVQAINTITILHEFKAIHERMNVIEKKVDRIIQRDEASYIGEVISAANRIDELENQFRICNHFSRDMIVRLALVEDKVNPIFERYKFLYESQGITKSTTADDLKFKQNDAYLAIILSTLDIRLDVLRLKLYIQENPNHMEYSVKRLIDKIDYYSLLWTDISNNPSLVEEVATEMKETVNQMNWWQRNLPGFLGGKRSEKVKLLEKSDQFTKHSEDLASFGDQIAEAVNMGENLRYGLLKPSPVSLVYWKDEYGEHSYYTSDITFETKVSD